MVLQDDNAKYVTPPLQAQSYKEIMKCQDRVIIMNQNVDSRVVDHIVFAGNHPDAAQRSALEDHTKMQLLSYPASLLGETKRCYTALVACN
jgi:hypothetical protein